MYGFIKWLYLVFFMQNMWHFPSAPDQVGTWIGQVPTIETTESRSPFTIVSNTTGQKTPTTHKTPPFKGTPHSERYLCPGKWPNSPCHERGEWCAWDRPYCRPCCSRRRPPDHRWKPHWSFHLYQIYRLVLLTGLTGLKQAQIFDAWKEVGFRISSSGTLWILT